MFTKTTFSVIFSLSALQHLALGAPADGKSRNQPRAWDGPIDIPEGDDMAVSFTCGGEADYSATQDSIAPSSECLKIPGGADEIDFAYDRNVYSSVLVSLYATEDCSEIDYGWWKNLFGRQGVDNIAVPGVCSQEATLFVQDDDTETAKWNSYMLYYMRTRDVDN